MTYLSNCIKCLGMEVPSDDITPLPYVVLSSYKEVPQDDRHLSYTSLLWLLGCHGNQKIPQ